MICFECHKKLESVNDCFQVADENDPSNDAILCLECFDKLYKTSGEGHA